MNSDWKFRTNRVDWAHSKGSPKVPALVVIFEGRSLACIDRLREFSVDESLPEQLDVLFRVNLEDPDIPGVLGIGNRLTGDYLLEIEVDRTRIFRFVDVVHRYADETGRGVQYDLWISSGDGLVMDYALQVLQVYSYDGDIIRNRSILPTWTDF